MCAQLTCNLSAIAKCLGKCSQITDVRQETSQIDAQQPRIMPLSEQGWHQPAVGRGARFHVCPSPYIGCVAQW